MQFLYYGADFMITWYLRLKFITNAELEHYGIKYRWASWESNDEWNVMIEKNIYVNKS